MFNFGLAMQVFFRKLMNAQWEEWERPDRFLALANDLSAIAIRVFPEKNAAWDRGISPNREVSQLRK